MVTKRKGMFSLYNIGIGTFFGIALVLVVIFVNIGFAVNDSQKKVVEHAYDEVRERLEISGRISAVAEVSSNEILITSIPVRTASAGPVNLNPESLTISYRQGNDLNSIIDYDNIFRGILRENNYRSLTDAMADANRLGILDGNILEENFEPATTDAFAYWIINQNKDNFVNNDELAVIVVVYAKNDRPSTGEKIFLEVNTPEGFVLRIDESIPNISNRILNFGGIISSNLVGN